jgi:hypothetical protein
MDAVRSGRLSSTVSGDAASQSALISTGHSTADGTLDAELASSGGGDAAEKRHGRRIVEAHSFELDSRQHLRRSAEE